MYDCKQRKEGKNYSPWQRKLWPTAGPLHRQRGGRRQGRGLRGRPRARRRPRGQTRYRRLERITPAERLCRILDVGILSRTFLKIKSILVIG